MSSSSRAEIDANQDEAGADYQSQSALDLPSTKSNANQDAMNHPHSLDFCAQSFRLMPCNALFWVEENALLVADLHLEKASFYAQTGQMLPPYDSRETLQRLEKSIEETGATRIFTLGDNFHDAEGRERLEPVAKALLGDLTSRLDWTWITGNHDDPEDVNSGGTSVEELEVSGIILRHEAKAGETRPEISGHFHPRYQTKIRGRHIRRPCAVMSENRMILPAFGALIGGMDAADPAIIAALQPARAIHALVATEPKLARFPLWSKTA